MNDFIKSSKSVVIISTQIWSDNWVSKHWIAVLLAKQGYKVFFIEPFRGIFFRGGRLRDLFFGPKIRKINGVNIVSISTLPGYYRTSGIFRSFYKALMSLQIKALNKLIDINYHLLTFDGRSLPFIKKLSKPKTIGYYCVDPVSSGFERKYGEVELAHYVDINIAISDNCADDMQKTLNIKQVSVLPHGMLFSEDNSKKGEDLFKEIDNLSKGSKKLIGYTGSIHDTYVNFDYIYKAIKEFKNSYWIFVGPYKGSDIAEDSSNAIKPILNHKRTSFMGNRPAWELANYIKEFDICLIPYRNDILNGWERRSPVKILHYLREGKPIVCADVPGVSAYKDLIYTYNTYEEFYRAMKSALSEKDDDPIIEKRIEFTKNREAEVILKDLKSLLGINSIKDFRVETSN
jgi:glycosyltransferase involved in cell wall biosynthesis